MTYAAQKQLTQTTVAAAIVAMRAAVAALEALDIAGAACQDAMQPGDDDMLSPADEDLALAIDEFGADVLADNLDTAACELEGIDWA